MLGASRAFADEPATPNLDVLRRWPRQYNWLIDLAGAPPNHAFNAIAALTLLQSASTERTGRNDRSVADCVKGVRLGPDPPDQAGQQSPGMVVD